MKLPLTANPYKISSCLLALSIASLLVGDERLWLLKPFELFFLAGGSAALFYLFPRRASLGQLLDKKIYLALALFFLFVVLATGISYLRYGIGLGGTEYRGGLLYLERFLLVVGVFTLFHISLQLQGGAGFRRLAWLAFFAPLVFSPLLLFPDWAHQHAILTGTGRFYGFSDPVAVATLFLIPVTFALALLWTALEKKRWKGAAGYLLLSVVSTALLMWTQTRGHWLGMAAATLCGAAAAAQRPAGRFLKKFFRNLLVALVVAAGAFLIVPTSTKSVMILRLYPQYTTEYWSKRQQDLTLLNSSDLKALANEIIAGKGQAAAAKETVQTTKGVVQRVAAAKETVPATKGVTQWVAAAKGAAQTTKETAQWFLQNEKRFELWRSYLTILAKNPLGLGFNRMVPELLPMIDINSTSPHNTFIDLVAWGGVGALAAFLYLLFRALRRCLREVRAGEPGASVHPHAEGETGMKTKKPTVGAEVYFLGVGMALVGLLGASLFDTLTFSRPLWILLAMALA